ncbi:U-box domain-containing protein 18 [Hirschfeldia incana]|nr:U-box domain-containing protein 18 [Hirschfeldia incana]
MIHTKTGWSRRILTFPAVQPCKSVSVTTLLDSLIQLAVDILTFKGKHFSTNKRSFQKTIRQIQNLAIVLEEIRIRVGSPKRYFPANSTPVSSLSEIHVIFQKLKYLLEDCTRDGARTYMLMSSDQVSDHLRVLNLSISTSLSAFPVSFFDLPSEVNELIELVVQQARKHVVRPDSEDKQILASVNGVLTQFEKIFSPDPDEINRILDHVGIRTWGDCAKEINFLGEEIEAERLENKKNNDSNAKVELLSSLMGFICYSRCVILRRIERDHHRDDHAHEDLIRGIKVEDLLCPISLEIMTDPVVLETGHTYDRSSITKWFGSGNITCPKTGKILTSTELVDNVSVSHVIQKHCRANGVVLATNGRKRKSQGDVAPDSLAAKGAGRLVARFLTSELTNGDEEAIYRALREIRVLTKTGSFNRSCLVEAGCVSPLLNLLTSEDSRIQESAMAGVLNLSKHVAGKREIVAGEGLENIVEILNEGARTETRLYAASALFYLSSVEDYSLLIGEKADAIPGLMRIVRGDEYGDSAKRSALLAVMGLLMQSENHWRVLAAGAVPTLLDLLRDEETGGELAGDCLATLAKLAEYPDGTIGVIRRGGLKLAVKILSSSSEVSPGVKQHCVGLVLNLCLNAGNDVVGVLVKNSVVMGSLYTVISNGEYGGSKKASALIRMIHEYQERRTGSAEPNFQRERRFIHAW